MKDQLVYKYEIIFVSYGFVSAKDEREAELIVEKNAVKLSREWEQSDVRFIGYDKYGEFDPEIDRILE
jgi:hypothetical protein